MTKYIEARRGTFGIIYIMVGGVSDGRTLTVEEYSSLLDVGIPVVRT